MATNVRRVLERLGIDIHGVSHGNMICRCPFGFNHKHGDKTPSFGVRVEDGVYNCFVGCASGSLLDLVLRLKGCDLDEAVEFIGQDFTAEEFYRILNRRKSNQFDSEISDANIDLSKYNFEETYQYIFDRGFRADEIHRWRLAIDDSDKSIVIPVFFKKKLVGIIKRFLFGEQRYWNSPSLPRTKILFGYDLFQSKDGWVNICEGPLDCIWLHQNGFRNSVATLGVGVSTEQFDLLKGMANGVRVCYDNDSAGIMAAKKIRKLYGGEVAVDIIQIPDGSKDIQECENVSGVLRDGGIRGRIGTTVQTMGAKDRWIVEKVLRGRNGSG